MADAFPGAGAPPIAGPLLAWYHSQRRVLPFREEPTPYRVWVSEVMLQQTRVAAALPYFERFMAALPDVAALAACEEEKLHKLWEGLGYYSRARNLRRAAIEVVEKHGGKLPADFESLRALPGIGAYTAGAIASIAFGLREVAVDGNVLRVASRLLASRGDVALPATKEALSAQVRRWQPPDAPGDFNQALMELGALVCTPKSPACAACPLRELCEANNLGIAGQLPVKAPKPEKKQLPVCLLVVRAENRVLLHRRPKSGLLAGLWEPLLFEGWYTRQEAQAKLAELLPGAVLGAPLPEASHVFTHRVWRMYGWLCTAPGAALPAGEYRYVRREELTENYALPGAFKAYLPAFFGEETQANRQE